MPKKIAPLTDVQCRTVKPANKDLSLFDGNGLFLLIKANGSKLWRFKYTRPNGKAGMLSFGEYPVTGLADARKKRDAARELLATGTDPSDQRKQDKIGNQEKFANTFEIIAREWHKTKRARWSDDHADRILDSLEKDVFAEMGKLPVTEISAPIILRVIKKIEKRGAVETAARVLQRISAVIRYAIQTGRAFNNPAADLVGVVSAVKVEHRPAMPRSELPEFFRRLEAEPLHIQNKLAMHLLAYTFVRPGELRGARWEEFDLERAEWRIPAERMKMRNEHIVPLSRQSLALLEQLRPLTGRFSLLFPAQTDANKPISENTLGYALGRMGYKGIHCPHGFRALASTILNEENFDPDVIERQLAHAPRDKIRAAYHRAQYLDERRTMMQWWADYLDTLKKNPCPRL
ncbi:Integrase [Formivibrio citricus]|uniref:Integrase n=1 Tax=Formivibrio citricus TaxID=83765 RepID=A0A1I4Z5D4_9NEIS|nr:integrase arm-type DNA-binding domain-containing protein [Formivibrio citricus]SFN45482.1 Integrase [Formivibrio citricus]